MKESVLLTSHPPLIYTVPYTYSRDHKVLRSSAKKKNPDWVSPHLHAGYTDSIRESEEYRAN